MDTTDLEARLRKPDRWDAHFSKGIGYGTKKSSPVPVEAADALARQRAEIAALVAVRKSLVEAAKADAAAFHADRAEIARLRETLEQTICERDEIRQAMHDAIASPKGVVPSSAEPFYNPEVFYRQAREPRHD